MSRRIIIETDGPCLAPSCNGHARQEVLSAPSEDMIERGAIARCHFDGSDYGELYDEWPDAIYVDGELWDLEEAKDLYRKQSKWMLEKALWGGEDAS